jgi:hypothetical protein
MIYVNMTDKFMSGWGLAPNRSHYCVKCETSEQADAIEKAARDRKEMVHITTSTRPRKARRGDHVKVVNFADLRGPWLRYWANR